VKLRWLLPDGAAVRLLDLGCAGGGLVRSLLADGCLAVGIEGSDVSKRFRLAEWGTCPWHLFTADLTHPFTVWQRGGGACTFNGVTAWEVLEHIPEPRVRDVIANVARHLDVGGYFIGSVDTAPDGNPLTGAVYHHTLRPKEWWLNAFAEQGFVEVT